MHQAVGFYCGQVNRYRQLFHRQQIEDIFILLLNIFRIITADHILQDVVEVIIFFLVKTRKGRDIGDIPLTSLNLFGRKNDVEGRRSG